MRQESIDLHKLMLELRARTDQQLEQQKIVEKLQTTNSLLEQSQVSVLDFYIIEFLSVLLTQWCYLKRFSILVITWRVFYCADIAVFMYSSGSTGMRKVN